MHEAATRHAALDLIARASTTARSRAGWAYRGGRCGTGVSTLRTDPPGCGRSICLRCWQPTSLVHFTPADYAELLGLYLGDGHVTEMARAQRLRLMLDAKYRASSKRRRSWPAGRPENRSAAQFPHEGRMVTLHSYHRHWTCLFPQPAQARRTIDRSSSSPGSERSSPRPVALLRGWIRSDGCVFINRTEGTNPSRTTSATSPAASSSSSPRPAQRSVSTAARTRRTCGSIGGQASPSCSSTSVKSYDALTLSCTPSAAVAELGRRAAFRSPWG